MKVPLVSAHVCFSGPLCKHKFMAACEDESHTCLRPIAPQPNSFSHSGYLFVG